MKRQTRRWMLLGLVTVAWTLSGVVGWAGEEEGAQPHFVYVIQEDVKPEQMDSYMKTRAADAKLSAQYRFEFPFFTFMQDFRVTTCGIFGAFAQLDGFPQKMEAWEEKTGGQAEKLNQQIAKCVDSYSTSIVVFRPDLSYWPKESAFQLDFSQPFYQMRVKYYIKPEKYEEAQAVAKKIKELNEKKQSPMGYWMYESIVGQDGPMFVAAIGAKDKAAFVAMDKQGQENPDPEMEKVFSDNIHLLRKIETEEGTFIPEASYVPAGTFGQ